LRRYPNNEGDVLMNTSGHDWVISEHLKSAFTCSKCGAYCIGRESPEYKALLPFTLIKAMGGKKEDAVKRHSCEEITAMVVIYS